jgi:integrase
MKGSVQKYGPTWRIRWDAGLKADGSRDQRSRGGFATRRDAEAALSEMLDLTRKGQLLDASKMTVAQFLVGWLESKRSIRATTRRAYEGHIRVYLIPHIGGLPLRTLRADHLDRMYESIRRGEQRRAPSAATIRRIHATLRTALNSAYKRRLISYNPAGQVELDPEPTHARDVWTPSQLARFLEHSKGDRLGPAYRLLALTGLRRGECLGLRWADVDLEAGRATISQQLTQSGKELAFGEPKTRRGVRTITLDAESVTVLKAHRASQNAERLALGATYNPRGLVFCREDGSPVSPERLSRHFLALSAEADLPRIVLHGLRHSHATHALAAGVPITVVSNRLGHSRSSFTADTYTRVLPEVDQEAAELIATMVKLAGGDGAISEAP